MPLDSTHQMTILTDILRNHSFDYCGTSAECEQLQRLSNALLENHNLDPTIRSTLQSIRNYGQNGSTHQEVNQHIGLNQSFIQQWLEDINDSQS